MLSSTLSAKGQVTIPVILRKNLHLQPGDQVQFDLHNNTMMLYKQNHDVSTSFGIIKAKHSASLKDLKKVIR